MTKRRDFSDKVIKAKNKDGEIKELHAKRVGEWYCGLRGPAGATVPLVCHKGKSDAPVSTPRDDP